MEIYRKVIEDGACLTELKLARIRNKEFKAEEVIASLKKIGYMKNPLVTKADIRLYDVLVSMGILIKCIGGKTNYKPIRDKFDSFCFEFMTKYLDDSEIFDDNYYIDDSIMNSYDIDSLIFDFN